MLARSNWLRTAAWSLRAANVVTIEAMFDAVDRLPEAELDAAERERRLARARVVKNPPRGGHLSVGASQ